MELITWSKTMLNTYKYLEIISGTIDNLVKKEALGSSNKFGYNNTFKSYERIIDLNCRKITLINLKVLIEQITESMQDKYAKFIQLHFIENFKACNVARVLEISDRTFFRRKNQVYAKFASSLKMHGYTVDRLENLFGQELWLKNALQINENESSIQDNRTKEYRILKSIDNDLKNKAFI